MPANALMKLVHADMQSLFDKPISAQLNEKLLSRDGGVLLQLISWASPVLHSSRRKHATRQHHNFILTKKHKADYYFSSWQLAMQSVIYTIS